MFKYLEKQAKDENTGKKRVFVVFTSIGQYVTTFMVQHVRKIIDKWTGNLKQ